MASTTNSPACLSCRHYRPKDASGGSCRLDKGKIEPSAYPLRNHADCCDGWQDVGQQFHIRVGWVRGQAAATSDDPDASGNGLS